ncbi:MAG TPA: hypothetical protein VFZ61_10080, partial [Polyangiales bacterium]
GLMEELERWGTSAPEAFLSAKAAHAELGPSETQLSSMLERLEGAPPASQPTGKAPTWTASRAKLALWLVSALTLLLAGSYLSIRSSTPAAPLLEPAVQPQPPSVANEPSIQTSAPALLPPAAVEPVAAPTPPRRAQVTPERAADPAAELSLLERARRVLAHDPGRTLSLTDEHKRTFRPGLFAEERELLAIEALVGLERRDAAGRRARDFTRRHPNSVHAHRLQTILQRVAP